jgi:hypothetical protein
MGETPCKPKLSYNETNLIWQPEKTTWSPPNNGSQCSKSLTNHSLLKIALLLTRQTHFNVSPRLANIGITSLALPHNGGKCQMGYSTYVENRPTPDSLPLGQEVVLKGLSTLDFSFYSTPKENNWESLSLKLWGPE